MVVGSLSRREVTFIIKMRNEARQKMREIGGDFRDIAIRASMAARDARRGMDQIQAGAARASLGVRALGAAMRAIPFVAIIAAITATARALFSSGDAYTGLENRLTSTGTAASETREQLRRLNQIARDSNSTLEPTVALYGRAAQAITDLGGSVSEAERFTLTWNRALAVGGAGAQEAASATLQFSQALGSGVLRGEEYNAVAEASPYVLRKMAEALGVTVGELRQMAQQGQLTGEVMRGALADMAAIVDQDHSQMARRADVAWAGFVDNLKFRLGEAADAMGSSGGLAGLIDRATAAVDTLAVTLGQTLGPAFELAGEVMRLAMDWSGISLLVEWFSKLGDQAQTTGASITAHIRAGLINATTAVRFFRESFLAACAYIADLFMALGNDIARPVYEAYLRIEALTAAMAATLQGDLREAGRLSGRAFGDEIRREALAAFREIEAVYRAPVLGRGTTAEREQAAILAQRANRGTATNTGSSTSGAPSGAPGSGDGEDTDRQVESTTQKVVEQTAVVRENISVWDAMRESAKAAAEGIKSEADLMREAWGTAFDHAGRALQQFVTTGEANFKALIAAILQEIAAMLAAEAWKQFMATMAGTSSGGSTSGGGSSGSNSNFWADVAMFIAGFFHDGGIVGSARKARSISPAAFAGAKRYHKGGMVGGLSYGEVPIIAKRNEAVMPTVRMPNGQLGVQAVGAGGGGTTIVNNYNVQISVETNATEGKAIGEEVGEAFLKKLDQRTSNIARSEILKANRLGGMSNYRP